MYVKGSWNPKTFFDKLTDLYRLHINENSTSVTIALILFIKGKVCVGVSFFWSHLVYILNIKYVLQYSLFVEKI